jgi:hypothetical protein
LYLPTHVHTYADQIKENDTWHYTQMGTFITLSNVHSAKNSWGIF